MEEEVLYTFVVEIPVPSVYHIIVVAAIVWYILAGIVVKLIPTSLLPIENKENKKEAAVWKTNIWIISPILVPGALLLGVVYLAITPLIWFFTSKETEDCIKE